jgi:hypothetical protein
MSFSSNDSIHNSSSGVPRETSSKGHGSGIQMTQHHFVPEFLIDLTNPPYIFKYPNNSKNLGKCRSQPRCQPRHNFLECLSCHPLICWSKQIQRDKNCKAASALPQFTTFLQLPGLPSFEAVLWQITATSQACIHIVKPRGLS